MIVKKELDYAKEVGDVCEAAKTLIADIRAKKSVGEITADAFPKLVEAVNGIDQVDDEVKANRKAAMATVGYHTGEIADAILG